MRRFIYVLCVALICGPSAHAQQAQLTGSVVDSTRAVVPQASVSLHNQDTGVKYQALTNGAGVYTFPFVEPGVYEATVERTGFKTTSVTGIKLDVSQIAGLSFTLQPASALETVTVSAADAEVLTLTPSLGAEITGQTVVSLPLNGRDYTQLVTLSAGAAQNQYSRATNGFSLNGGVTLQSTLLLDGVDNSNYMFGLDSGNINSLTPSVDAIQEFKVDTANFSAEYGRSADGVIRVVTKSGTNTIHGNAFEFLRNDALDANDYFSKQSGLTRPPLHRSQFGGTVGGPVIKNRTFFFVSYQGTRQTSSQTNVLTIPTQQMVTGNFSGQAPIYDPLNVVNGLRQQFPGNIIPTNRLDPVGKMIAALFPVPNLPGTVNNLGANQALGDNADQLDARFDNQFSEHDNAFFRYGRDTGQTTVGGICPPPGNCGAPGIGNSPVHTPQGAWDMGIGETHIFTSSLVNEFRLGYSHNGQNRLPDATHSFFSQFGIQGVPDSGQIVGLPYFSMSGYAALGDDEYAPSEKIIQLGQGNDIVSWSHGRHDVRFGAEFHHTDGTEVSAIVTRGNFDFNGQFTSQVPGSGTGSPIADLLLGQTDFANLANTQIAHARNDYFGAFVNDSWKLTLRLTVNLGLRYDLQTPWWERNNLINNFDDNPNSPAYGTLVAATNGSWLDRTGANLDTHNFAPRVGFAYSVTPSTVVRAAYGIFYGSWGYAGNDVAAVNPPFLINATVTSPTTAAASSVVLANGFPTGFVSLANDPNSSIYSISPNYPMPLVNQWNLSIQHEFSQAMSATISYVGSSTQSLQDENDINNPLPGPGPLNPRRPFPTFGEIFEESPFGHSTYEGFQTSLDKRYSKGIVATAAYTWSHSIDNLNNFEDFAGGGVPQNPFNLRAEKASSDYDHRNVFTTSVVYDLPIGRKGGFLGGSEVKRAILSGWQAGGIFGAQSGYPLTLSVSPNPSNTETPERPNSVCNGNLSHGQRTASMWFNTSCFTLPAPFTYGDSGRGEVNAPGLVNADLMVNRTFHFTESRYVTFRGEFFNFTNSEHFGMPNGTLGESNFGSITNTAPNNPAREIELALKVYF